MRKTILLAVAIIMAILPVMARDHISRDPYELPQDAREMISTYFAKHEINRIKIGSGLFGHKDYEVILDNGTEIEFDNDGKWTEIDCGHHAVPPSLIPHDIINHVKSNYAGRAIVKIERKKNKYEIELSNDVDLVFDKNGRFLHVDR